MLVGRMGAVFALRGGCCCRWNPKKKKRWLFELRGRDEDGQPRCDSPLAHRSLVAALGQLEPCLAEQSRQLGWRHLLDALRCPALAVPYEDRTHRTAD